MGRPRGSKNIRWSTGRSDVLEALVHIGGEGSPTIVGDVAGLTTDMVLKYVKKMVRDGFVKYPRRTTLIIVERGRIALAIYKGRAKKIHYAYMAMQTPLGKLVSKAASYQPIEASRLTLYYRRRKAIKNALCKVVLPQNRN